MLGVYKYVTVIDYDEFIVPVKVGSITNLLSKYEEMGKNSTARRAPGGYKISVTFFYTHLEQWRDVKGEFLTILRKVYRTAFLNHKHRTKYITNPARLLEAGIHDCYYEREKSVPIPHTEAFIAHYRYGDCPCKHFIPGGGKKQYKDLSMNRFKDLMKNSSFYHKLMNMSHFNVTK